MKKILLGLVVLFMLYGFYSHPWYEAFVVLGTLLLFYAGYALLRFIFTGPRALYLGKCVITVILAIIFGVIGTTSNPNYEAEKAEREAKQAQQAEEAAAAKAAEEAEKAAEAEKADAEKAAAEEAAAQAQAENTIIYEGASSTFKIVMPRPFDAELKAKPIKAQDVAEHLTRSDVAEKRYDDRTVIYVSIMSYDQELHFSDSGWKQASQATANTINNSVLRTPGIERVKRYEQELSNDDGIRKAKWKVRYHYNGKNYLVRALNIDVGKDDWLVMFEFDADDEALNAAIETAIETAVVQRKE